MSVWSRVAAGRSDSPGSFEGEKLCDNFSPHAMTLCDEIFPEVSSQTRIAVATRVITQLFGGLRPRSFWGGY